MEHPILLLYFLEHIGLPLHVTHTWFLMIVLTVICLIFRGTYKLIPGKAQVLIEAMVGGIYDFFHDINGEYTRRFFPLLATLGIYIFLSNIMALIPLFDSPTNVLNTTASMAIVVFLYYNYCGIRHHGFGYVKHFLGPIWWLAPLFLVVEIISHFSRMLSLSFRRFGNIRGKDFLLLILFFLLPYFVPLPIMVLGLFVAFIQALIFTLLTSMYLAGAMAEEH
jgi:F-type H+-transporting ATPase subunit a